MLSAQHPQLDCKEVAVFSGCSGVIPSHSHLVRDRVPRAQSVRMVGWQHPQPDGQDVAVLGLSSGLISARRHLVGDYIPGGQRVGWTAPSTRSQTAKTALWIDSACAESRCLAAGSHICGVGGSGDRIARARCTGGEGFEHIDRVRC